jgi:hypothetical protein
MNLCLPLRVALFPNSKQGFPARFQRNVRAASGVARTMLGKDELRFRVSLLLAGLSLILAQQIVVPEGTLRGPTPYGMHASVWDVSCFTQDVLASSPTYFGVDIGRVDVCRVLTIIGHMHSGCLLLQLVQS